MFVSGFAYYRWDVAAKFLTDPTLDRVTKDVLALGACYATSLLLATIIALPFVVVISHRCVSCYDSFDGKTKRSCSRRTWTQGWKSHSPKSDASATLKDGPQGCHGAVGEKGEIAWLSTVRYTKIRRLAN